MKRIFSALLALLVVLSLVSITSSAAAKNPYEGKVFSILSASAATYKGYIPTYDGFNWEHACSSHYPDEEFLTDVNETWWMRVINELNGKLGINDSWSSTEIGNIYDVEVNSGYDGTKACMASLTRIQNLGSNGTPDVIMFLGGGNDISSRRKLGTFDPATAPTEVDLTATTWDTVADAYVAAIMRMQYFYPDAEIVAMLPKQSASNSFELVGKYNAVFAAICEHYDVAYVDLRYCGITDENMPDGSHPNAEGMKFYANMVLDALKNECSVVPGENIVHTVTHKLTGAKSSLSYYKGVTHGKPFVTTISGENLNVSVTMGGKDITADCYADGVISIEAVTGKLVITANGTGGTVYSDHIREVPSVFCKDLNLWKVLGREKKYYNGTKWSSANYSITIPVKAGDKLWATSFQKKGTNGGTKNGIRVTWFDKDGVLKSMTPSQVYAEFSKNGYITAPKGAVAVNVPMWNNKSSNKLFILNRNHEYDNGVCISCRRKLVYWDQLQQLPETYCCDTNLLDSLDIQKGRFNGTEWVSKYYSVTIPIKAGDKIWSTSFQKKGVNGGSNNGMKVTWFDKDGVLKSPTRTQVYEEFTKNGYITAPKGAAAVCINLWNNKSSNELYILNRSHKYKDGVCTCCDRKLIYWDELQQLPETFTSTTNLLDYLTIHKGRFNGTKWVSKYYSVTIPIKAGDQLWCTSFQKKGLNGGINNGMKVTWFDKDGNVISSPTYTEVYNEFKKYGYITAPKKAVVVCVNLWTNKSSNELYILNRNQ